jgi:hypothetical protein
MTVYSITEHGVLGTILGEFDEHLVDLFPFLERPAGRSEPLERCTAG